MPLGYGYDMVLLPPRHPTDHDHELSQLGGVLHRYRRSHRARVARRRRAQRSYHHRLVEGDGVPCSSAPQPDADIESLNEDLRRMSLAMGKMSVGHPDIPSSDAAPLLVGSGLNSPAAGTMPPWTFPYGLNTAAQGYVSSISTNMGVYEELPGHHLCSALDLIVSTLASEYLDSTETPSTELRATASRRYDSMN
jgi:hypothetical protein